MGSFERKMQRNALKEGHKRLKKQWKAENDRRASGVFVPVENMTQTAASNNSVDDEPEVTTKIPMVPNVSRQRLPMLGRPPSLGQYKKILEDVAAKRAAEITSRKQVEQEKKAEDEKKIVEEGWKEQ